MGMWTKTVKYGTTSVRDVANTLIKVKEACLKSDGKGCVLLVGAGCSVSAGVPLASKFVEIIKSDYSAQYILATENARKKYSKIYEIGVGTVRKKRKTEPDYYDCMEALEPLQRRELIAKYIDEALINWAHICIATLMDQGYVDRILTTNFDPLVARACSYFGLYPAIYDFAASAYFDDAQVPSPAVFHLHGQRSGFFLWNTEDETKKAAKKALEHVIDMTVKDRYVVVIGYGGTDPVIDLLSKALDTSKGVFWISNSGGEPKAHIYNKILDHNISKRGSYFGGEDADTFLIKLVQDLNGFPPSFVSTPFSHLERMLDNIADSPLSKMSYSISSFTDSSDSLAAHDMMKPRYKQFEPTAITRAMITRAKKTIEQTPSFVAGIKANTLLMNGKYNDVIAMRPTYESDSNPELGELLSWAYIMKAVQEADAANDVPKGEQIQYFKRSETNFQEALKITPDKWEALNNWAIMLLQQIDTHNIDIAKMTYLYEQAIKKCKKATSFPHGKLAEITWIHALNGLAYYSTNRRKKMRLLQESINKCERLMKIMPDEAMVSNNYANALAFLAKMKGNSEATRLYILAYDQYAKAVSLNPNLHQTLHNWGATLMEENEEMLRGLKKDELTHGASAKFDERYKL